MRRCRLNHLKNSSACRQLLYRAQIVNDRRVALLVKNIGVLPDSGSLKRMRRKSTG